MQAGKLPLELLTRLLGKIDVKDPRVVLGAKPGEDAALIDFGDRYLVTKTDPITFATDLIGWYLVQVNSNDLAVMGATPKWLMVTLLLPEGSTPEEISEIFDQLLKACEESNITLVGGHTEVTYDLSRPIAVGSMFGEVDKDRVVLTSGARPGVLAAVETMIASISHKSGGAGLLGVAGAQVLSLKDEAKALLQDTPGLQLPSELLLYAKTLSYLFALGDELEPDVDLLKLSTPYILQFLAQK